MTDQASGELLLYRLRQKPEIDKYLLFEWIRQLLEQLDQYHRCKDGRCYRYLNPYSVLITSQNTVRLLNLEAEENVFVLRNMQSRAMREHFIRPIAHRKENTKLSVDLYGFGKTVQFMLASSSVRPALTKSQENRFIKIIDKCLNENPKKQYEEWRQIKKELPAAKPRKAKTRKKEHCFMVLLLFLLLFFSVGVVKIILGGYMQKKQEMSGNLQEIDQIAMQEQTGDLEEPVQEKVRTTEIIEELQQLLLQNSTEANLQVIEEGEELKLELLRCLSTAYDREGKIEEALSAYEELCGIEIQKQRLQTDYLKRMTLEAENGYGGRLLQTGKEARERLDHFSEIAIPYLRKVYECEGISLREYEDEKAHILQEFPELKRSEEYRKLREEVEGKNEKNTQN